MELSKHHIKTILEKLQDVYPLMLESEGYRELTEELGSDVILDAHLLYLWEKGIIDTEMKYDPYTPGWTVSAHLTRINASGIDLLVDRKS
ncbi:hypothetical protein FD737_10005 [Pantoea sp. Seng]|uniref:hypothetical protein n=1 Tax=Pantoea sp. Seng TaxID=2576761 RepID=UPI00132C24E1|nr:hypothetical protein [Pantoea sp. Seng]MXP53413.1 hypothetical protein [Pantoea sp. Seng]